MNNNEFALLVSEVYKKSFLNIMENYHCDVIECDVNDPSKHKGTLEFSSTASIDAGAKDFEMCIALKMPYATLEHSMPSRSDTHIVDEGELEDWLCEISNLVVGCVKEELLRRNCRLQIGLPNCAAGKELKNIIPEGYKHSTYHFTVQHEYCESVVSLMFFEDKIECATEEKTDRSIRSELEVF